MKDDLKAIKLRGKGFFNAYYDPWQAVEQVTSDGWFSTGDLGVIDDEGYLFISGRTKDIINVAGMKIFPQEVEAVLESHPVIKEACVFAHGHDTLGEIPYAYVVLKPNVKDPPTEADLKNYCIQHLSQHKIPGRIMFINSLKRTASGKLMRDEARII